ncbi:MAG: ATP-binding cassette subfamily B protein [Paraglaciecola sp.]|jgi:ATP-binding cassette subfamily B protein
MSVSYFYTLIKIHKLPLIIAILLMVFESIASLSVPWLAGRFSESILQGETIYDLSYLQIAFIWLFLFVLQAFLRFASSYRISFVGAQMLTHFSCRLYDHIQLLPLKYFDNNRKGEILALLSNDVAILSYFFSGVIISLIPACFIVLGTLIMMFNISTVITLMIMLMVPAFFIILKVLGRSIKPLTENLVQQQANSVALASEAFGVIKLVKSFARENLESDKFKHNAHEIQALRKRQLKIQSLLSPLIQMLVSTGVLVVVVTSAVHYQSGELSIPDLITLFMYGMLFARPMSSLASLYGQVQQALGASSRINKVFALSPEPIDSSAVEVINVQGQITFDHVSFAYEGNKPLLNKLSLEIAPKETIVILGPNGIGKTTLLHLLMRFVDPTSGKVCLDGAKLNSLNLSSLRKNIGFVSQDIALCNGTILDNISYGYPQASAAEIEDAAIKAGAAHFINALEQGYHTYVGENGVLLSGGQRQRISLARALLAKPSILLLDEPTSMIDKEGKAEFHEKLRSLFIDQTVLIVTHDKAITRLADRAFIMENGKLFEYTEQR